MNANRLNISPDKLYSLIREGKINQRQKRFMLKALKETGHKVIKKQKKYVNKFRGKHPFKPKQLPLFFENFNNLTVMMACLVSAVTGTRRTETTEILKRNIDFNECRILLEVTKAGEEQDVFFPKSLSPLLKKWCHYTKDSKYLFPSRYDNSKPLAPESLNSSLNVTLEKAGLQEILYVKENNHQAKKYGYHSWRKFFTSWLVNNDVSMGVAQRLLRHKKIELTQKAYALYGQKKLSSALSKVDPFNVKKDEHNGNASELFAHQTLKLWQQYSTGELNEADYLKQKNELLSLQKALNK